MANAVLDPTGKVSSKRAVQASRRPDLRGATVGLLVNTKRNADLFLEELGRLLVDREGAADVVTRRKTGPITAPAPDEVVEEMAGQCDVVVTGVGDCGSCSAAAVADGLLFEGRGIPSAVVCSDAFTATSDAMARVQGAPGYRYATTPHPVAVLTPDEVRERAGRALPDVVSLMVAVEQRGAA
ncbi:MAG: UGSC family (seleno)protein [Streptosporangiaceae bacterium]